ncbi:hypothetical protein SLA2020_453750 [Shorea laevis]
MLTGWTSAEEPGKDGGRSAAGRESRQRSKREREINKVRERDTYLEGERERERGDTYRNTARTWPESDRRRMAGPERERERERERNRQRENGEEES